MMVLTVIMALTVPATAKTEVVTLTDWWLPGAAVQLGGQDIFQLSGWALVAPSCFCTASFSCTRIAGPGAAISCASNFAHERDVHVYTRLRSRWLLLHLSITK